MANRAGIRRKLNNARITISLFFEREMSVTLIFWLMVLFVVIILELFGKI
ncbi:hypothetical protein SAMN05216524_104431 [Mucilaginibacter sp. OK098]|nr:hypothetical protein SAMN05216524_104431 [Mucilaginibacter sp. OK098]